MADPPKAPRRRTEPNVQPKTRAQLESEYGDVYDTGALARRFILLGLAGSVLTVRRKCDGATGTLLVQTRPCLYFGFRLAL